MGRIAVVFGFLIAGFVGPDMAEYYQDLRGFNSVVQLNPMDTDQTGGTGFVMQLPGSSNVVTISNHHVCEMADENGYLRATQNGVTQRLKVLYRVERIDLCALTPYIGATPLSLADSAVVGEDVAVYGHPLLRPLRRARGYIVGPYDVELIVKYLRSKEDKCEKGQREEDIRTWLGWRRVCIEVFPSMEITAGIHPGNSGSPVLDKYGHVVGVIFAGQKGIEVGYMVPLEHVKAFASKVRSLLPSKLKKVPSRRPTYRI